MNTDKITRVEVIDTGGRAYTNNHAYDVEISFQDDNRTLKIFLKNRKWKIPKFKELNS